MALGKNSVPFLTAAKVANGAKFFDIVSDVGHDEARAKSRLRSASQAYKNEAEIAKSLGNAKRAEACESIAARLVALIPKKQKGRSAGAAVSDEDIFALVSGAKQETDGETDGDDANE